MAKKKKRSEKKLKAKLKRARAQRDSAERSAEKWKARAKQRRVEADALEAELSGVRRRLAKAETATPPQASATARNTAPDESWTVTRLRAEARTRGVPGYSRQSKAQLLTALRG